MTNKKKIINKAEDTKKESKIETVISKDIKTGLCFRCEERAKFLENGHGSRCECSDINSAVYSCYMYKPVKPVIMAKNKDDKRPQFAGWMFSARSHYVRVPELKLDVKKYKDGNLLYWKI